MDALPGVSQVPPPRFEPDSDKIKQRLLKKGVYPTPKIIHTLRKKEIQKHDRKLKRLAEKGPYPPLTESQTLALAEESHFQTLKREYKVFCKSVSSKTGDGENGSSMVGRPWERLETVGFKELASTSLEYGGKNLKKEELRELKEMFEARRHEALRWVLDDDVEIKKEWLDAEKNSLAPLKRTRSEVEEVRFLVDRLSAKELNEKDWKLSRMMKQSGLQFTEDQLLMILQGLGSKGCWRQALGVVQYVFDDKKKRKSKSRFVYTKLLSVLGKARRPDEALEIFNLMRGDFHIYPDMAAYHSIAVTLGQSGCLKKLLSVIECMRQNPSKKIKNMRYKNWDPVLEPDVVVYNAVLNACVSSQQWKGVSWVFDQLRKSSLKPNGATYGLAMEVMLESRKFDLVHEIFRKMKNSGVAPKALTYKVLVKAFWGQGEVNEAVEVVGDMEKRGIVGASSVYYELACCLCNNGRWQDAIVEVVVAKVSLNFNLLLLGPVSSMSFHKVEKMKKLTGTKPLEVAFTGMIISAMDGGHIDDCISIFGCMKNHCTPNIGTINIMLKVYRKSDMFSKAKELFEETTRANSDSCHSVDENTFPVPDKYTYSSMLEASAFAQQWEYFEYVYKEMALAGYQLDQSKHGWLLVEASKSGKWHLLEHAFNSILEAGEIPHHLYFTELVVQFAARHDYERAVSMVSTMAYAPFQVNKMQWKELFEKNESRIRGDNIERLLEALSNCDVTSEATVVNLSKALCALCKSGTSRNISSSVAFGSALQDKSSLVGTNSEGSDSIPSGPSEELIVGCHNSGKNPLTNKIDVAAPAVVVEANTSKDVSNMEMISGSSNHEYHRDGETITQDLTSNEVDNLDSKLSKWISFENSKDDEDTELETLMSEDDDTQEFDSPSAYEVLEAWKACRKEDGFLFPFQFGKG